MKAYQLTIEKGIEYEPISEPFEDWKECLLLLKKIIETPEQLRRYAIHEVKLKEGDYYRNGNTLLMKDEVFKGVVKGVYYHGNQYRI